MTTNTSWAAQLGAALPTHTHHHTASIGSTHTWTTPTGTWKINRTFGEIRIDGTYTHVQAHLDPSQTIAILRILGAIDSPEQTPQILGQTLTDEPECQRCHGYGHINHRICPTCTEVAAATAQP